MRSAPWLASLLFLVACGGAPAREAAPASTSGAEDEESVQLDSAGSEPEIKLPTVTIRREMPKVGRNDPCPCGSGKKYKQCHGA